MQAFCGKLFVDLCSFINYSEVFSEWDTIKGELDCHDERYPAYQAREVINTDNKEKNR